MKNNSLVPPRSFFMALMLALVFGGGASAVPEFTVPPIIRANPNESVPLAAIVSFEASEAVGTTLTISDGERTWNLAYPSDREPRSGLPVVGMKYGVTNQISIKIVNASGETATASKKLAFATPFRAAEESGIRSNIRIAGRHRPPGGRTMRSESRP